MEKPKSSGRYIPQVRHAGGKRRREDNFGPPSPSRRSTDQGSPSHHCGDKDEQHVKQEYIARNGADDAAAADHQWPLVPAHFHDLILDRLSVRERCRMRCVCKAWNNAGTLRSGKEELWFIMVRPPRYGPHAKCLRLRPPKYGDLDWRFQAYSNRAGEELAGCSVFRPPLPNPHHSELSALLGGRNCSHIAQVCNFALKNPPFFNSLYLSSAGGLISAIAGRPGAEHSYDFIIFNCLTGCAKVLPPPKFPNGWIFKKKSFVFSFSMTLDWQDPSCYYLLLSTDLAYFEFFESRNACWKAVRTPQVCFKSGQLMRAFVSAHPSSDELSVFDADFWWLESSRKGSDHCLLAYHARQDAWTSVLLPFMPGPNQRFWPKLVVRYKGRLLLGLELVATGTGDRLGFGVWELQPATSTWVEIARTPEHLLWPGLNGFCWRANLSADGGVFCMSICNARSQCCKPPLVFDMPRNAWYSLPLDRTTRKFGCISVFRPSFTASV